MSVCSKANLGQTHQRFTIAGSWFAITTVDNTSAPITDYQFNAPVEVCIPLPDRLRMRIDDVAIVAMTSGSESFAVLSSRVRLTSGGSAQLCGNLSALPANIAAAKRGAPDALPTLAPSPTDESALPETGGFSWPTWTLILAWSLGATLLLVGGSCSHRQRKR